MDSEKFDKVVLDLLYDELDELTRASAMRHLDQSASARELYSELRATRQVGVMPLVEPPEDLEARILAAEQEAREHRPMKERFGSFVSILASYTMRPQLAMAALLLLMLGSSLLFLRARPGAHETMQVTERGVPETEGESIVVKVPETAGRAGDPGGEAQAHGVLRSWKEKPAAEGETSDDKPASRAREETASRSPLEVGRSASAEGESKADDSKENPYGDAMLAYRDRRYGESIEQFDEIAGAGGPNAAAAALFAARATQQQSGCAAATSRYERVAAMYGGSAVAHEATWLAGECYRQLGQTEDARRAYRSLTDTEDYGDKSKAALLALGGSVDDISVATREKAAAAKKPAASAAPARPTSPAATAPAEP